VRTRLLGVLACLALLACACGSSRATEAPDGSAVRWIDVDGRTNRFNSSFLAYFPERVMVRPGDSVIFRSVWTGEPHTVTMGTIVDRQFAGRPGPRPPKWTMGESQFLPPVVGRPCYLTKGAPPKDEGSSCPVVSKPPAFDGTQTYYSSGFLPEDARFRVNLAKDIEPGTYTFFCSFHGSKMSGEMTVVDAGTKIPSQDEVDAAAKRKLSDFVDGTLDLHRRTYEPFDDARSGRFPWPALASFESHGGVVKVLEFVPFTLKAKVDERVSWSILGAHTIAFDAPENAQPPAVRILSTGETEIKADATNESRSREPPVGAPKRPVVIESGPYDDGFLSSGMLYSPRRSLITYALRFGEPGTYRYQCLLHPRMTGLVIVSV
jgi:plastocyanin